MISLDFLLRVSFVADVFFFLFPVFLFFRHDPTVGRALVVCDRGCRVDHQFEGVGRVYRIMYLFFCRKERELQFGG